MQTATISPQADDSITGHPPLRAGFTLPTHDLSELLQPLGARLYKRERTMSQLVTWSVQSGLLELLNQRGSVTFEEAASSTPLTIAGADALLSVLSALGLAKRSSDGSYSLTRMAQEYLLRESPFFVGDQLETVGFPIPGAYLKKRAGFFSRLQIRLLGYLPEFRFGSQSRLGNQHARNLAACAAAVRTGEFAEASCIVDIAGGSGVFAIPLVLEYGAKRLILTEVPRALPNIQHILAAHGLADRIELRALDAFEYPWKIPQCDGIFIGNFLHGFSDETSLRVCCEALERLSEGGTIWLHEMLWNDTRDGPLITALWHAAMLAVCPGGQRTGSEWTRLLQSAGFVDTRVVPTACGFGLVIGRKPVTAR